MKNRSAFAGSDPELAKALSAIEAGQVGVAKSVLLAGIASGPTFLRLYWLSVALSKLGENEEACAYANQAVSMAPDQSGAWDRLGNCHLRLQNFAEAERCLRESARLSPPSSSLYGQLGIALQGQGRLKEAFASFEQSVLLDPKSFNSYCHLATTLLQVQEPQAALKAARRALSLNPDSNEAQLLYANSLLACGRPAEAEEFLNRVHAEEKQRKEYFALIGQIRQALGRNEEAVDAFAKALEIPPLSAIACLGFARNHRFTPEDAELVSRMSSALKEGGLPLDGQRDLHFAQGKADNDLGEYQAAMEHYDSANLLARRLRFGETPFDTERYAKNNDFALEFFSRDRLSQFARYGSDDSRPVFVVGMMRSGTTLTEQILASHPEIGGAGELTFWTRNNLRALNSDRSELAPSMLAALADEYLGLLGEGRHVVDKMPGNYAVLPVIHLALRNARYIHVRRNPLDTCLSIWMTPNSAYIDWAHDKENIAFVYSEYLRLMDEWRQVIPEDRLLEISYEELVTSQEEVTRRMISFLGLEWDEACLRPSERKGLVSTPSAWQVRQPIYTSSVERWRRYEPWLGAFRGLTG